MSLFQTSIDRPNVLRRHPILLVPLLIVFIVVLVLVDPFGFFTGWTEGPRIRVVKFAEGLEYPWGLAFLPNGDMLVTERPGRLRIIRNGTLDETWIPDVPQVVQKAQAGLMDVAVHPHFAENRFIYLTYSKLGRGDSPALLRAQFDGKRLTDIRDIFVADAWSDSGGNTGSRIVFGNDGMIYMTVGDRHQPRNAQDLLNDAGKVLRLRDDGTVPIDNPFVGRSDAKPEIFCFGNRNPQGLAIHPFTGGLFETEHGPRGGDEVNILLPGRNYGWPVITYGINYDGSIITNERARPGMEQPLVYWVPSIGPSGLAIYSGDRFPEWKGNLFAGAMAGAHLRRIVLDGTRVIHEERLVTGLHQRIRDVRQGPDGFLYLLTDSNYGEILRIERR